MTQQVINIGTTPNDGTGDQLRTAFDKSNDNFAELYAAVPTLQPLDADLTSIAGLTGVNIIYYRSAADTWSAITIGTGLSFSGGTLSCTVSTAGFAPINSPTFTGDPKAPTPTAGDNDTSIATTAFVTTADNAVKSQLIGSASSGMDTLGEIENYIAANITPALGNKADLFSPTFTGDPKAPTPATADNDTSIATTAFVKAQGYAPLNAPVFTGDARAVTPTAGDNDTSIATTAFVTTAVAAAGSVTSLVPGCGRLEYSSATQLVFKPFAGNKIKINGTLYTIPNAGIAGLTNTGCNVNTVAGQNLAANTTYAIFAFNNAGTVTATFFNDLSHAPSTTSGNEGVEISLGFDAYSLIGMCRTNASAQFVNDAANRFVRSWFNRDSAPTQAAFSADRGITSTTFVEVHSEIRNNALIWSDEIWLLSTQGAIANSAASQNTGVSIAIDSATPPSDAPGSLILTAAAGAYFPYGLNYIAMSLSEGFHYATVVGTRTGSGTGVWRSNSGGGVGCTLMARAMRR